MAVEALIALGVITIGLLAIAIYADKHRVNDTDKHDRPAHSN